MGDPPKHTIWNREYWVKPDTQPEMESMTLLYTILEKKALSRKGLSSVLIPSIPIHKYRIYVEPTLFSVSLLGKGQEKHEVSSVGSKQ